LPSFTSHFYKIPLSLGYVANLVILIGTLGGCRINFKFW
jgi:hypothetical protein